LWEKLIPGARVIELLYSRKINIWCQDVDKKSVLIKRAARGTIRDRGNPMSILRKTVLAAFFLLVLSDFPGFGAEKIPIAIMNFQITNLDTQEVKLMIDFFNNELFETGVFDVVQSDKRDSLLRELEFSQSDFADHTKTRNIGKLLSVKLLVFGSVGKLGTNVLFNASCVDVETGKTVGTFSNRYKSLDEIVDILPSVSKTFASAATRVMFVKKATILYHDDFEGTKNWMQSPEFVYRGGSYSMYPKKSAYYVLEDIMIDDFILESTAEYIAGERNSGFGITFRFKDENHYYAYWISQTGYYKVVKYISGEYIDLIPWTRHSSINESGPNKLKVSAIGTQFIFYINNIMVKEIYDTSVAVGGFGFYVFQNVNAVFDDVFLYQGNLLIFDTFSKADSNWTEGPLARTKDGVYLLDGNGEGCYSWSNNTSRDISFRAETYWRGGAEQNQYGLIFRFQDISNHYCFTITKNGYYLFGYFKDGKWVPITDFKKSRFINTESKNLLRVECVADSIKLYINDNLVESIADATFSSGSIGFVTFLDIIAAFDNVEVFLIE